MSKFPFYPKLHQRIVKYYCRVIYIYQILLEQRFLNTLNVGGLLQTIFLNHLFSAKA